jgi:hypothetical protein
MNKFCIIGFGKLGLLHACITNNYKNYKLSLVIEKNFWIRFLLRFILKNVTIDKNLNKKKLENIKLVIIATQPSQTGNILYQLLLKVSSLRRSTNTMPPIFPQPGHS